ncbi:MAG: branched-chain amino acid transaminase [Gammaproteobacteria bacterium]
MSTPSYIMLDGELVPFAEATVHVTSGAFKFGTAVFEGIRGYWNDEHEQMYLFRLDDHMRRLEFSQRFMRFEGAVSGADMALQTLDLLRANELRTTVHIMSTVYVKGSGPPAACAPIGTSVVATPGVGGLYVDHGCAVQISSWRRLADDAMPARVKCNANYQNGRVAIIQAREDGYDTVLMLNGRGKVAEGPGMCLFMIRDGLAVTPNTSSDILESITRETVMELLPRYCGIEVIEREIDRSELVAADEAFFCGTAWEVTPIASIDRLPVGEGAVGPVTRKLQDAYFRIVKGETEDFEEWRTGVY